LLLGILDWLTWHFFLACYFVFYLIGWPDGCELGLLLSGLLLDWHDACILGLLLGLPLGSHDGCVWKEIERQREKMIQRVDNSIIWYMVYGICYMGVYGIWYMVYIIWYMVVYYSSIIW
jgi:hypothetical protein